MNLYLDSMLWVYFFEQNPQFHPPARALLLKSSGSGLHPRPTNLIYKAANTRTMPAFAISRSHRWPRKNITSTATITAAIPTK